MARPQLFLIDSFGFIFRAFHARARSAATPMRTASGVPTEATYIFNNMIRRLRDQYQPEYLAAIFESEGPNFRNELFAEYKANRSETPPDLLQQIPDIKRLLEAMRVPVIEAAGFEADDVIGTLAHLAADQVDVVIVSSDKDMLQLVGPAVTMMNPMKDDLRYDESAVEEFMGVKPPQVVDLLALKGDSVDNIPGAPGIGDKGARDLIQQFGNVEASISRADEVSRKMYRESLQQNREQILLSKDLARIRTDVPLAFDLEALRRVEPDRQALEEVYRQLEFHRALREIQTVSENADRDVQRVEGGDALTQLDGELRETGRFSVIELLPDPESLDTSARWYLGLAPGKVRVLSEGAATEAERWLADRNLGKVFAGYKEHLLRDYDRAQVIAGPVDDVLLMGFLLYAEPGAASLSALSERRLQRGAETSPEGIADLVITLHAEMLPALRESDLESVYQQIDLPLSPVLARMEHTGVRVDRETLAVISERMQGELESLTARIHDLAGHEFNINSPQQLAKILFDEMGLPAPVKTGKGKVYSTAADVLESLAVQHPIAALVLDFRQIAKLKGTYVDALPALIRPETGRIHTSFNQAGAATGRLSSSNPNLQNIPIRSEQGREIRAAFVPEPGWTLLAADYSQIELRLLAHFSEDRVLVDSFQRNEDIHTRTASEVFGVMPALVNSEMRRSAKAVNFGIVYGQTAFGLAAQLGIGKKEAEQYIDRYFNRYQGVRAWIAHTIEEVRASGFTRTMFGRMRPIPDINVRNPNARSFAERTAVNTPLQGTAADLIKLAMIRIQALLESEGLRARMLLQVHDELVFEAPEEEAEALIRMVRREMEGVASLRVPLVADVGRGSNWRDAK